MLEVEVREDAQAFQQGSSATSRERHLTRRHEQERAQLLRRVAEADDVALAASSRCRKLMQEIRYLAKGKMKQLVVMKAAQTTAGQSRQQLAVAQEEIKALRARAGQLEARLGLVTPSTSAHGAAEKSRHEAAESLNPFAAEVRVSEQDL